MSGKKVNSYWLSICQRVVRMLTDTDREAQEDAIREAVFRYLFDHNASELQSRAHAYCLGIRVGDKTIDPSNQFIRRFAHHTPAVRKASGCGWKEVKIVESRHEKPALIFYVGPIKWVSDAEVDIDGGYDEANVSSAGCPYIVKQEKGAWSVIRGNGACVISQAWPTSTREES
jgi:hypothetical protein